MHSLGLRSTNPHQTLFMWKPWFIPFSLSNILRLVATINCNGAAFPTTVALPFWPQPEKNYKFLASVNNVLFVQYDASVSKNWNPKNIFTYVGKNYFWGYFSSFFFGIKLKKLSRTRCCNIHSPPIQLQLKIRIVFILKRFWYGW